MNTNEELIKRARRVANKGVAKDDGFRYSVPAADLVRYGTTIHELADALESATRTHVPALPDEVDGLRKVIEDAPHDRHCLHRVADGRYDCNCWKASK